MAELEDVTWYVLKEGMAMRFNVLKKTDRQCDDGDVEYREEEERGAGIAAEKKISSTLQPPAAIRDWLHKKSLGGSTSASDKAYRPIVSTGFPANLVGQS